MMCTSASQLHNEYLQFIFEYGVIGVALAVAFFWKRFPKNPVLISIFTIGLVNAFFHFNMHISSTALVIAGAACFTEESDYDA